MAYRKNRHSAPAGWCFKKGMCPALGRIIRLGTDGPPGSQGGRFALRSPPVRRYSRGGPFPLPMLYVPGGWASKKLTALGNRGQEEIRRFVEEGGSYLGICGGAGMATEDGIGLMPIQRKPTTERVPSVSGPVRLSLTGHKIWQGIDGPIFFAWWPSQFRVADQRVHVLACYEEALPDAFSSDIPVADGRVIGWPALEARYGILLDPSRLHGEPAVLEGNLAEARCSCRSSISIRPETETAPPF